jgi:type IV pilus assembly protein PilM
MFDIKDLFSGKKQVVGLDIGSSSLKLAEVLDSADGYLLNHFSQVALPRGVIVDGQLADQGVLTEKVKEIFKNSGCSKKAVVTSLSGHSVIVKKVNFSTMEEEELRELIRDEAAKYLPFDNMDDINFDFQILGASEYNPNQMDVLIVAAKKEAVNSYVDALTDAGLSVAIMDVDSFALETMYEENYDYQENDMVVVVNIGASITNIGVIRNATSVFTRDFTMGGNAVTEAMQEKFGLTFEEAERIKTGQMAFDDAARREVMAGLLSFAEPLILEIERSIEYFQSSYGGVSIKKIILSGGGANLPGLAGELYQRLNIETEIVNPFRKVGVNRKKLDPDVVDRIAPIAAVGVGLALRRIGD